MPDRRPLLELACRGLLLAYLCWLPLPFGSVIERAQLPLVVGACAICALAMFARTIASAPLAMTPAFRFWTVGAALFAIVVALQLLPLPRALLGVLSPGSLRIWSDADRVASLAGVAAPAAAHPMSVDPELTLVNLFRVVAYLGAFLAAALLMRRHRHRIALAVALGAAAVFETLFGVREAALHRYAIWGWVNKLVFNRATGTFVNPNHFAHYAAIVLPLGLYLAARAWHDAAPPGAPPRRRIVRLFEKQLPGFGFGVIVVFACLVAILVAQSRGALVALVGGVAVVGAIASGRRHALRRGVMIAVAVAALIAVLVLLLGLNVSRFSESETATFGGRGVTVKTAFALWKTFPLFGSGLGTFAEVSSMTGVGSPELLINHAHDDYAELAATTGIIGLLVALVPLLAGYVALLRLTFGAAAAELTWTRRAYQAAALTSLTIAMIHALIDFNFFIPANPATLAAISGTAVALREPR